MILTKMQPKAHILKSFCNVLCAKLKIHGCEAFVKCKNGY